MNCFENVKKNFGFGCMRLPMKDGEVDKAEMCRMVDAFLARGFNYFDTAHGYLGGKSEIAVRECLAERYPRDAFILTDKLTGSYFHSEADIRPFFESQLKACGVEYFDFYLMHSQNKEILKNSGLAMPMKLRLPSKRRARYAMSDCPSMTVPRCWMRS